MIILFFITLLGWVDSGTQFDRFEIVAMTIDGRLAFVAKGTSAQPPCISRIQVIRPGCTDRAADEPETVWRERVFAWSDYGGFECVDNFPIFYGEALNGRDRRGLATPSEVAPKTLEAGVTYTVTATTAGLGGRSWFGGGSFRLGADGLVDEVGPAPLIGR
jgi:hypothetical protein